MRLRLVIAAVCALPSLGLAQEPRLRARLDPATATRVERLVDSAKVVGLPTEPLIQKALEGQTKGATADRIVGAVGSLLDGLGKARQGLGPSGSAQELEAGVLWIRAGGGVESLERLRKAAPDRQLAVPIAVSADLLAKGWPPMEATAALETLFAANVSDAGFLAFRNQVDSAIRNGAKLEPTVRAEVARLTTSRTSRP
jgi:hypothetical protein